MKRVTIASRAAGAFVGILGFFGFAGMAIGAMVLFGAHRIAVATPGTHESGLRIVGGGIMAIAAVILWWFFRQATAIREIEIADDGGWTLITRRERRIAVPAGEAKLDLHGYNVWLFWGVLPRRINVCSGHVAIGGASWRLVQMAPTAYDDALSALGISEQAPRNGRASYVVRRAA